jgi:hypothetical protein
MQHWIGPPSSNQIPGKGSFHFRIPHGAAALKRANVTCVQVKYDGLFDYGIVEDPIYLTSNATQQDDGVSIELHTELRVFFSELLELRFPAWDNAEGAHGEFQWDLNSDLLRRMSYKPSLLTGLWPEITRGRLSPPAGILAPACCAARKDLTR